MRLLLNKYFEVNLQTDVRQKANVYAIIRTSDGIWAIVCEILKIKNNDLHIKIRCYHGTRGLYELLFKWNIKL